jgi:aminoglycoside 6'-N-acetyltransferase
VGADPASFREGLTMPELRLRAAELFDIPVLKHWDAQPHVISTTSDDPAAATGHDVDWAEEIEGSSDVSRYYIAELAGRPIGAMQIIDPNLEPTHYWGKTEPNLRALDIWIGDGADLGHGYGETMMRLAFAMCFADGDVTAILIDPLASNTRAHKFYERIGFVPIGRQLFNDEDDCLVLRLTRGDWRARFPGD